MTRPADCSLFLLRPSRRHRPRGAGVPLAARAGTPTRRLDRVAGTARQGARRAAPPRRVRLQKREHGGDCAVRLRILPSLHELRIGSEGRDLPGEGLRVAGVVPHQHQQRRLAGGDEIREYQNVWGVDSCGQGGQQSPWPGVDGVIAKFVRRITPRAGMTLWRSCKPLSYLRLPGCAMQSRIRSQTRRRSKCARVPAA